jgi:hypothetical protein
MSVKITNTASTLIFEWSTPYDLQRTEMKSVIGLRRKLGSDQIDIWLNSTKKMSINWNDVTAPATASADDLFVLLSSYLNVPIGNIRAGSEAVTLGANTITFSTTLDADTYILLLWSPDGAGLVETARTDHNFTVDALADGTCVYYAILS